MIVVDTSAIVAILRQEPEADQFTDEMLASDQVLMSAPTYVELSAVVDRGSADTAAGNLDALLEALGVEVVNFTAAQARIARRGYATYGKGSGHAAGLNFGDCFAYALAVETGAHLLFKGTDFTHTDAT